MAGCIIASTTRLGKVGAPRSIMEMRGKQRCKKRRLVERGLRRPASHPRTTKMKKIMRHLPISAAMMTM
jgi:hypothetical protein